VKLSTKVKLTIRGYRLYSELFPWALTLTVIQSVMTAIQPFLNIFLSARIIDALVMGEPLQRVMMLVIAIVSANCFVKLTEHACTHAIAVKYVHWRNFSFPQLAKCQETDYEKLENAETHQKIAHLQRVINSTGMGLPRLCWAFQSVIQAVCSLLLSIFLMSGAFISVEGTGVWRVLGSPWLSVCIIGIVLAKCVLDIWWVNHYDAKGYQELGGYTEQNRVGDHYYQNFMTYHAGKDMKLYQMQKILKQEMAQIQMGFRRTTKACAHWSLRKELLCKTTDVLLSAVFYSYVAVKALFGAFGVGSIVQYAGALTQFGAAASLCFTGFASLSANARALSDLFEFLDTPNEMYRGSLSTEKRADRNYTIEFQDVSFRYPGTDTWVLRHVSLQFRIGSRLAIVGENGSGKSTLIKLLCRLYDPTEGRILLNGIDIRKYDYAQYQALFSVVFQDYRLFSLPLGENVAASRHYDAVRVTVALQDAGFGERLAQMPQGLSTYLYRDFDESGVELSGGEAQKIAIARALYKDAPFLILDEPTAALDPVAEAEIYSQLNAIVDDRTAVYISHRLSSCRFCDQIAVFDHGKLVEFGTHEELVSDQTSKYFALWNAQAQYYEKEGQ